MRRFTLDERSVFNIQYPTRNFQQGSRCRIAALLQAIFTFLDLWIFRVGYWRFKEGLSNLVTTYNVTIDVRNQSSCRNLDQQRAKMLHCVAPSPETRTLVSDPPEGWVKLFCKQIYPQETRMDRDNAVKHQAKRAIPARSVSELYQPEA